MVNIFGIICAIVIYIGGVAYIRELMDETPGGKDVSRFFFPILMAMAGWDIVFDLIRGLWSKKQNNLNIPN